MKRKAVRRIDHILFRVILRFFGLARFPRNIHGLLGLKLMRRQQFTRYREELAMKSPVPAFLVVSLLLASFALGQSRQGQSGREGVMQSFDRKSPPVGELLPDVKAFNAAGETIQLGELRGDYTVLVFGCLT